MPEFTWISDEILTVDGFATTEECARFIAEAESAGFDEAPVNTIFGPVVRKDVRNNTRLIRDDPALAEILWERAKPFVPEVLAGHRAVGVNERFRFYRYDPGQAFRWHRDGYFERESGERSRLTFMIYLNDDFEGGETEFNGVDTPTGEAKIRPAPGKALFFVHRVLHQGAEVRSGRKYVLRSDVMYSR
jgi:predicted 2-oxoglutarate/Fe(II)-dependent dioxygenase YbiX